MTTGRCFKCRTIREISSKQRTIIRGSIPAVRGVCAVCGTKMFRILRKGEIL